MYAVPDEKGHRDERPGRERPRTRHRVNKRSRGCYRSVESEHSRCARDFQWPGFLSRTSYVTRRAITDGVSQTSTSRLTQAEGLACFSHEDTFRFQIELDAFQPPTCRGAFRKQFLGQMRQHSFSGFRYSQSRRDPRENLEHGPGLLTEGRLPVDVLWRMIRSFLPPLTASTRLSSS